MTITETAAKQNNTITLATSNKYIDENVAVNLKVTKAVLTTDSDSNSFSVDYPTGKTATFSVDSSGNTTITGIPTFHKIYQTTFTYTASTSTSWTAMSDTFDLGSTAWTKDALLYITIRNNNSSVKYIGCDAIFTNMRAGNNLTTALNTLMVTNHYKDSSNRYMTVGLSAGYGICPTSLSSAGVVSMRCRYHSTYTPGINQSNTYTFKAYLIDWPTEIRELWS